MTRVEIGSDSEILVDGRCVGTLRVDENHLEKIEIESQFQGEGYGTEAIQLWLQKCESRGYERATTSTAVSRASKQIFDKLGFRRIESPEDYDFPDIENPDRIRSFWVKEL